MITFTTYASAARHHFCRHKQMGPHRVVLQGDVHRAAAFARARVRAMGLDVESLTADDDAVCVFNASTIYAGRGAECITVLLNPAEVAPDRVPTGGTVLITTPDASRWGGATLAWLHGAGFQLWLERADGQFGDPTPSPEVGWHTDLFLLPPMPTGMDFFVVSADEPVALTLAVGSAPIAHSPAALTHKFQVNDLAGRAAELCLAAGLALNAAGWDVGRLGRLCVHAVPCAIDTLRVWGVMGDHCWAARAEPMFVYDRVPAHARAGMWAKTDRGFVRSRDGTYSEAPQLG